MVPPVSNYIGRLAPSPTGYLHLGHASTFWTAQRRAHAVGGRLLLRNDDLDASRVRPEFVRAMIEDMRWLGLSWEEPMVSQSERLPAYREALAQLHREGLIFPCTRTRRELAEASISAPHEGDDEPLYPAAWRPPAGSPLPPLDLSCNWRLRVPDGETLTFNDGHFGVQSASVGHDFGDFLVWRKDGVPSYQLACAVDDAAYGITEVVRGADLIKSTFRQLLLFRALGQPAPAYYHCPLVRDETGQRLAKRHDALSLRALRERGVMPESLVATFIR
ncbi:MAG: tRNA glutamyl-Q(34) synthetase GluQRS [Rariglobus sp.]